LHQEKTVEKAPDSSKTRKAANEVTQVVDSFGGFLKLIPVTGRVVVALAIIGLFGYVAHLVIPLVFK
jgi:hypothetical protein